MAIVGSNILAGASGQSSGAAAGYEIERSLRFNSADTTYLSRTLTATGSSRKFTWSYWIKNCQSSITHAVWTTGGSSPWGGFYVGGFWFKLNSSDIKLNAYGDPAFRDFSAWQHWVIAVDTEQATATDRFKVYVNGVYYEASGGLPSQNSNISINTTGYSHYIGGTSGGYHIDAYLAEFRFIDGQQLSPTDFGEYDTNNVWQPIEYTGAYGTNGVYLKFDNTSDLGEDSSGNNNDFTANNFSVTAGVGNDSLFDSPTNGTQTDTGAGGEVSGNYATLSPLDIKGNSTTQHTLSNGNLQFVSVAGNNLGNGKNATIAVSSGKWYWEITASSLSSGQCYFGFTVPGYTSGRADNAIAIRDTGAWYNTLSGATVNAANLSAFSNGDVIGFALDLDNQKFSVSVNGTFHASADPAAGTNPNVTLPSDTLLTPTVSDYYTGTTLHFNFGQRPFAYSAPSGFKALCTANLDDPTIADGSTAMDVVTWTGDGTTPRSITGLNFSPDFVWTKNRTASYWHNLYDIIRGTRTPLHSNTTTGDDTANDGLYGGLSSFDSDGFTLADGTATGNTNIWTNISGYGFVGWCWDGGTEARYSPGLSGTGLRSAYLAFESGSNLDAYDRVARLPGTGTITWTAGNNIEPIGNVTNLDLYIYQNASNDTVSFTINGSSATPSSTIRTPSTAYGIYGYRFAVGATVSSFSFTTSSASARLKRVSADGVDLTESINTDGSLPAAVNANASAGFSIVSYTGTGANATVGHGLGVAPAMVIIKSRTTSDFWVVGHTSIGFTSDNYLILNDTVAAGSGGGVAWNNTAPTSTVVHIGSSSVLNGNGNNLLMLAFAPVAGYSAFGSYVGDNATTSDSNFVYLGFRPRFLMIKCSTSSSYGYWHMLDAERDSYNVAYNRLAADSNAAENNYGWGPNTANSVVDFLSNGFKIRTSGTEGLNRAETYIYAAFAETPFKYARAR